MPLEKHIDVLHKLHSRLQGSDINWALTGSLSLALQGVPVEVHDIDIQTNRAGAYKIETLFHDSISRRVRFSTAEKIRSHCGGLLIDGIEVEIMGDIEKQLPDGSWDKPPDLGRHRTYMQVDEMRIPVLALEYEYEAYSRLGRADKVEALRRWLQGKGL